jgi:hypothetical protein
VLAGYPNSQHTAEHLEIPEQCGEVCWAEFRGAGIDSLRDAAVDEVREWFGSTPVTRGPFGRDTGLAMPLLPD